MYFIKTVDIKSVVDRSWLGRWKIVGGPLKYCPRARVSFSYTSVSRTRGWGSCRFSRADELLQVRHPSIHLSYTQLSARNTDHWSPKDFHPHNTTTTRAYRLCTCAVRGSCRCFRLRRHRPRGGCWPGSTAPTYTRCTRSAPSLGTRSL